MNNTESSPSGAVRFLIFIIAVLLLLNLARHFTWNSPAESRENLALPDIALKPEYHAFEQPTHIANAGDGSGRIFVTEQKGRIILIKGGAVIKRPFLDIRDRVGCCGERGLLSIAFPPGYRSKRYFYVNYTDLKGTTVIARYRTSADPDLADRNSEEKILQIEQPYANHNGGQLAFGPDGYLYIGMGDGGSAGDPHNHAQNPASLLGKMLRIDVESGKKPYAIPPDNPFVRKTGYRPEIWSTGLRNPWRFSFDRKTGELYIADVGQNSYEEINIEPKSAGGRNYGWKVMEGLHCYSGEDCNRSGLVLPVAEYDHSKGCSVTGGFVYRGGSQPALQGIYFYGDYCSGRIWGLRQSATELMTRELKNSGLSISTFGEDENGEIYAADYGRGNIYRISAVAR